MKTFVIGSLQAYTLARPPVVAFTLSLVAITVTVFLVAFNIKDKDLVLDSHAQEDWNSLVKHLTSQKLCINISDIKQSSRFPVMTELQPPLAAKSSTCLPVIVDHSHANSSLKSPKNVNAVRLEGHITLKGWNKSCQNQESSPAVNNSSAAVTLILPMASSGEVPALSWLYFSGLPHLKQPLNFNNSHCPALNESVEVLGSFSSFNIDVCKPENVIQLSSNISDVKAEIYLSVDSKLQIFSNLLQIGYLFLGVISILLLAAMIQGRSLALSTQHTLLPTKEMS